MCDLFFFFFYKIKSEQASRLIFIKKKWPSLKNARCKPAGFIFGLCIQLKRNQGFQTISPKANTFVFFHFCIIIMVCIFCRKSTSPFFGSPELLQ